MSAARLLAHPLEELPVVHQLFTGSWIDENGSAPGVDLGTWIGEEEENRAWGLLRAAREELDRVGATPEENSNAFDSLYTAEGSDWFWWYGTDQESGNDGEFDALFRTHLQNIYRRLGLEPPEDLERHIVPHSAVWTFTNPVETIQRGDRLVVRTHCPGILTWTVGKDAPAQEAALVPAGGAMAGVSEYNLILPSFDPPVREVRFRFRCTNPHCSGQDVCCRWEEQVVRIV